MKRTVIMAAALTLFAATSAARGADERVIEKRFEIERGGKVGIGIGLGGDIELEAGDRDWIGVRVVLRGPDREEVEVEFDESGSKLEIEAKVGWMRDTDAECDIYLEVPEDIDVEFETYGGDVSVTGVKGDTRGRTMGGDMEFGSLDGTLEATTMGGDISVHDSRLDGRVRTMGGDVTIRKVEGDLKGSTMGGDVSYEEVSGRDDEDDEVSITTMGGDLSLDYEGKAIKARTLGGDIEIGRAREVDVTTMGGDIEVEEAPLGVKVSTMGGDITVGSAGGFAKAKTMGGDIDLGGVDGWIEAETMGGDIFARMTGDPAEGRRDVDLESKGGDIELIVPEGLSMEFDIEIQQTKDAGEKPRIISDFDIEVEETDWESRWFSKRKRIIGRGETGGGENTIRIRTINGNVTIRKGD